MHKINFSGHPVAGYTLAPFVGVNLPMQPTEELVAVVSKALLELPCKEELLQGESVEVILPGMSPVAGILLAQWHGLFGRFPTIRWAVRTKEGFVWPDDTCCSLDDIRFRARTLR